MLYTIIITFALLSIATAYSRCLNFGKLNYTCIASDYCNANENLSCGDGTCG